MVEKSSAYHQAYHEAIEDRFGVAVSVDFCSSEFLSGKMINPMDHNNIIHKGKMINLSESCTQNDENCCGFECLGHEIVQAGKSQREAKATAKAAPRWLCTY